MSTVRRSYETRELTMRLRNERGPQEFIHSDLHLTDLRVEWNLQHIQRYIERHTDFRSHFSEPPGESDIVKLFSAEKLFVTEREREMLSMVVLNFLCGNV